ncbi:MAG: helix-turn-helix domain-containing protein [Ktedonobacterales bacterium]
MRDKLLLSVDEASELIGFSGRQGWRFVASGDLFSVKRGRRRLVPRQAVDEFVRLLLLSGGPPDWLPWEAA